MKGVRVRWQLVYQIYLPAIDTLVIGMVAVIVDQIYLPSIDDSLATNWNRGK